jgi:hypothetical protein
MQNQRTGRKIGLGWADWYQWKAEGGGEMVKEGEYGTNTMYTYGKMVSVETIPGMGGRGKKENSGRNEFEYDIFDIL